MSESAGNRPQRSYFGRRTGITNPYIKTDEASDPSVTAAAAPQAVPKDEEVSGGTGESSGLKHYARHDALLPISIVGGLCGMLVGTLPAAIWVLIFGKSFSPMFMFLPLTIFWGITAFKGCTQKRGFIVTCVFSVVGFYLTVLSCQASLYVLKYKVLYLNLPFVTATLIGRSDALPGPILSSAYIFPFVFTLLGVFLVYELASREEMPSEPLQPERHSDAAK